jgi:putative transposon-encoded protein
MLPSSSPSASTGQIPNIVIGRSSGGSLVEKIVEIQKELILINKHKLEHNHIPTAHTESTSSSSCVYCQRRRKQLLEGGSPVADNKAHQGIRKVIRTSNEIERLVDTSGKNGSVTVPKSWAGKKVKIILLD